MIIALGRLAVLATAFTLATIFVGWWAVAAVGVLWGGAAGGEVRYAGRLAGLAAGIGWLALVAGGAPLRETVTLATTVGHLLSVPGLMLATATLGLGAVLGLLGSWLGSGLRAWRAGPQ